ncbi:MAG: hypothetical protein AB7G11_02065 [Phycisphaerales bacterium]
MAKFRKVSVDPQGTPEEIWNQIRAQLLVSQSVELVAVTTQGGKVALEVRAWNGVRKDTSNSDKATPGTEY